ncbi:alpha/beta fold hydrolase [Streptomyces sp. NBC_01445]|uniref:alpha/beta fold hydrolase n=1 Tax=Streptomyces sp. NBC_01445 TaxID=2903869 RepID=UPI002DD9EC0E|nr:alpha/beta fold hydrolase [Streptomyces sp. NBC_01445]WSE02999.1 alpha/beta hydrolase [Streptomyces sp. NBC_01445]
MFAKINGTDLFFDVVGSGLSVREKSLEPKPVLFVHHGGPGGDHSHFRPWLDGLQDTAQIVYFDHRGTGRSGRADVSTYTLEQMADDIEALRLYLGIEAPVLLGASFGGMVALQYAIRHPDSLSKLILVDTAPSNDYHALSMKQVAKVASAEQMEMLKDLFAGTITPERYARWAEVVGPLYYRTVPPLAEREAVDARVIAGPEVAEQVLKNELPLYDVRAQLGAIHIPTLVATGRHDWVTPPSQSEEIVKGIPHADLHIFENSGHNPLVEETHEFLETIARFIRS